LEVIRVVLDRKSKEKGNRKEKEQLRVCKSKCTLLEVIKNARH